MISQKDLELKLFDLIKDAETSLPEDITDKLNEAIEKEENALARIQLKQIIDNISFGKKHKIPICQDTGLLTFYVKLGIDKTISDSILIEKSIKKVLRTATKDIPLRDNVVDPLSRKISHGNVGEHIPKIIFTPNPEENHSEITLLVKGAGSENMSFLSMLKPGDVDKIKYFVISKIKEFGKNSCPPLILGIGIGGSADIAMDLAKKALLRNLNDENKDPEILWLEEEILKGVNDTKVGIMGLGKGITCLKVNIEKAGTHTASLPVAINFGCWALRKKTIRI